jgi:hypothetical protein
VNSMVEMIETEFNFLYLDSECTGLKLSNSSTISELAKKHSPKNTKSSNDPIYTYFKKGSGIHPKLSPTAG